MKFIIEGTEDPASFFCRNIPIFSPHPVHVFPPLIFFFMRGVGALGKDGG